MKRSVAGFMATQIVLCITALFLCAIDTQRKLIPFFHLPHMGIAPPPLDTDFWNCMRFYKSTYYLAAVIVVLSIVGLAAGVAMVIDSQRFCGTLCPVENRSRCFNLCGLCFILNPPGLSNVVAFVEVLGGLSLAIVLVAFVGLFALLAALVLFLQCVWQRCLELGELRLLASEFIVADLSLEEGGPLPVIRDGVDTEDPERARHELSQELDNLGI